jgi:hypothetical protein
MKINNSRMGLIRGHFQYWWSHTSCIQRSDSPRVNVIVNVTDYLKIQRYKQSNDIVGEIIVKNV